MLDANVLGEPIAMPPNIAALPRDERGYPIVFVNDIAGNVPDFRITNMDRWTRAVASRLCGICGKLMGYWLMFIGDERNVSRRIFHDAPMHVECARYAMMVCPFLALPNARRSGRPLPEGDFTVPPVRERPPKMALYRTRSYSIYTDPSAPGGFFLEAAPAKEIEWF